MSEARRDYEASCFIFCLKLVLMRGSAWLYAEEEVDETQNDAFASSSCKVRGAPPHPKLAVIISCHTNKTIYVRTKEARLK